MYKLAIIGASLFRRVFLVSKKTYLKPIIAQYVSPEIAKSVITDDELCPVACSGNRSGYVMYQSDKKLIYSIR